MKISSMRYLIHQCFKGIWKNRIMSFASFCIMLVSLLMVGLSVLLALNINRIIGGIEDKSEVVVQIKDGISDADREQLKNTIGALPNVNTIEFYSKENAWKSMMDGMTQEERDLFNYADDNPLPDTFRLTVHDIQKMTEKDKNGKTVVGPVAEVLLDAVDRYYFDMQELKDIPGRLKFAYESSSKRISTLSEALKNNTDAQTALKSAWGTRESELQEAITEATAQRKSIKDKQDEIAEIEAPKPEAKSEPKPAQPKKKATKKK